MSMPITRSGRPNTSGTRGGQAQQSPLPLAEEEYSKDNEQKFRRQLMDMLAPLKEQSATLATGLNTLVASFITNDSGADGATVADALDAIDAILDALATTYQPLDSDLTAIAALTTTAYGRGLLALADAAALRTAGGLVIGANVQAYDATLATIAALTGAADKSVYFTGADVAALYDLTAAGRALIDDADAAAQRATLSAEQLGVTRGVNTQTGNYIFVLTDAGKTVEMNVAGANTLTVPASGSVAFAIGTYLNFSQYGGGQTTLTPDGGVTLRNRNGLKTGGQYAMGTLYQRATDEWVVGGDLTP